MTFHDKFLTEAGVKVKKEADRSISSVITEAVAQYLQRSQVRPAFREAMEEVLDEHAELLDRLAK